MKEVGFDFMFGGGVEIFYLEICDQIAGGKCMGEEWLCIYEIWYELGMCFNVVMFYGYIEEFWY